jgi:nitrogen fixation NifU-like protein
MYTERVVEHFRHPHNMGKMKDYSAVGRVGNILCGDVMWLYIRVETDAQGRDVIADVSWETFGCTAAIATSSMVSDLAKGKTLDEAISISNRDVADELGGLPPVKMHCSGLAADALSEAIYEYLTSRGRPVPPALAARHDHLQKDMAKLEERYKVFLDRDATKGKDAGAAPTCS